MVVGVVEGKQFECGGGGGAGQTIEIGSWGWWTENNRNSVLVVVVEDKQ